MNKRTGLTLSLAGILILALGLRIWGIGFGLPYAYHFDEPTYVSAALNLGAGIIGRQPNPTGFSNILFSEYAAYFIVGRVGGLFASVAEFEQAYRTDPSTFLLLGRLTSAFLGTLSVLVVYWLGREVYGRIAGWLAALFLAVTFLHVRDSHYAVPDITSALLASLSVLLSVLAVRRGKQMHLYLAAAVAGYAVATKWSVWTVAIPLVVAVFHSSYSHREQAAASKLLSMLPVVAMSLLGGFLAGGFQLVLKPTVYLGYAIREWQAGEAGGFQFWQIDTVPGWLFYLKTLYYGLGVVLLGLALAGCLRRLVKSVRTRNRMSILLLSFPLTYYLLMGTTRHYFARYALPLVPFMALFAAEAIMTAWAWVTVRRTRLGWGVAALLAVAAIAQPLAQSIRHDVLLTRQDTRTVAKQWIEANIPQGVKIAVDWPVHGPPLSTPERQVPRSGKVYNVLVMGTDGTGLSDQPIEWYREQDYDYLIASSFIYNIPLVYEDRDAERRAFYASLDDELELVREFRSYEGDTEPPFIFDEIYGPAISLWQRERPGPTLKIYRVER